MRGLLLIVGLVLGIQLTTASVIDWFAGQKADGADVDRPQGDDPGVNQVERQVHSLLEAMKGSFGELSSKRNSWYDRYDELAKDATSNSAMIVELLTISRVAMPIIWTTSMASRMQKRHLALKRGAEVHYEPPNVEAGEPVPHPLRILPMKLTERDDFNIEVILKTNAEVNVGIRLMFEPEDGHVFDWDNDDILLGIHLRWHFNWGNDREVSLHDKYGGSFRTDQEVIIPEANWPDIKVGETFAVGIQKTGNCFTVFTILGKDLYAQEQYPFPYTQTFCPTARRTSKMIAEPKKLRLVVNEDNPKTGEVEVYNLAWYPSNVV